VRFLVVTRPRAGVEPARDIAPHAAAELATLATLRASGLLVEAYSPGGPGAVLIFEGTRAEVDDALEALPLVREQLIESEVTPLTPFPGFGSDA